MMSDISLTSLSVDAAQRSSSEIKDEYTKWLQSVYNDKSSIPLRKRKKKSKQQLALKRMIQPTIASSMKAIDPRDCGRSVKDSKNQTDFPLKVVHASDTTASQKLVYLKKTLDKVNYIHYQSCNNELFARPGLGFFQWLLGCARKGNWVCKSPHICDLSEGRSSYMDNEKQIFEFPAFPVEIPPILVRLSRPQTSILMVYTSSECADRMILKLTIFTSKNVFEDHISSIVSKLCNNECEIAAVLKQTVNSECKNNFFEEIRSPIDLREIVQHFWEPSEAQLQMNPIFQNLRHDNEKMLLNLLAVQKYIPSKGTKGVVSIRRNAEVSDQPQSNHACDQSSMKNGPWIARIVVNEQVKSPVVWIIHGDLSSSKTDLSASNLENWSEVEYKSYLNRIVKCTNKQAWKAIRTQAKAFINYLNVISKGLFKFSEMVMDFLESDDGTWWLLQVKAFLGNQCNDLGVKSHCFKRQEIEYRQQKRCKGKFCSGRYQTNEVSISICNAEPCNVFTRKDIISYEFYHLYYHNESHHPYYIKNDEAVNKFKDALVTHFQWNISKRDKSRLYEVQYVCEQCNIYYQHLRQLFRSHMKALLRNSKKITLEGSEPGSTVDKISSFQNMDMGQINSIDKHEESISTMSLPSLRAKSSCDSTHLPQFNSMTDIHNRQVYLPALYPKSQSSSGTCSINSEILQISSPTSEFITEYNKQKNERHKTTSLDKKNNFLLHENERNNTNSNLLTEEPSMNAEKHVDAGSRIDAMWNDVQLNSLQSINRTVISLNVPNCDIVTHTINYDSEADVLKNISTLPSREVHSFRIPDSRKIFYDDVYYHKLLQQAQEILTNNKHMALKFSVVPINAQSEHLAAMALRTIFLDLRQSINAMHLNLPEIEMNTFEGSMSIIFMYS